MFLQRPFCQTDEADSHWVGIDTTDGRRVLHLQGPPRDATCGREQPEFDTVFDDRAAVAERTFGDCQSAQDYHDWLVVDLASGDAVARLACQGPGALSIGGEAGRLVIECAGARFETTLDALWECYAG